MIFFLNCSSDPCGGTASLCNWRVSGGMAQATPRGWLLKRARADACEVWPQLLVGQGQGKGQGQESIGSLLVLLYPAVLESEGVSTFKATASVCNSAFVLSQ